MKTIFKIVLVVLVITVCFQASRSLVNEYQFEDAVQQVLLFDPRATDAEIVRAVMKLAPDYQIVIDPADVVIHQSGQDVNVAMTYTENIKLIPGVFARDWTFHPSASTRILVGNRRQAP